ncbi:hypothetical protein ACVRW7_08595 [Streptococcus ratti]
MHFGAFYSSKKEEWESSADLQKTNQNNKLKKNLFRIFFLDLKFRNISITRGASLKNIKKQLIVSD